MRDKIFQCTCNYYESIGSTVFKCCTYGTLGGKSAIQVAGKGLGYNVDDMRAVAQLIKTERGETWTITDMLEGNKEKNRQPQKDFENAIKQYNGLLELSLKLEGLICSRGIHASGMFIINGEVTKYGSLMKAPDGTLTSQYDLHDAEYLGMLKYDYLTTSCLSKIQIALENLVKDGLVEDKGSLKANYMSILDPTKMNYDTDEVWDAIANNELPDLFQFDSLMGIQTILKIKPRSLMQLAQANSLMRLMAQDGAEAPVDTYVRFLKKGKEEWLKEVREFGVREEDIPILDKLLAQYNYVLDSQESMMIAVQDPNIGGFTISEANKLRKSIAKKLGIEEFNKVRDNFYEKGKQLGTDRRTLEYLWEVQISRQRGYSFSLLHTTAYTFIALQELVLFTQFPKIYWYSACLTVNAGAINLEDIYDDEDTKDKTSKYVKVAKAINKLTNKGIKIEPPLVNLADYEFTPKLDTNSIVYSIKGISGVGKELAYRILHNRQDYGKYESFEDFYKRILPTKGEVYALIKCGALDEFIITSRTDFAKQYILQINPNKEKITGSNLPYLIKNKLVPSNFAFESRLVNYRKYIYQAKFKYAVDDKTKNNKNPNYWYKLDNISKDFFEQNIEQHCEEGVEYNYTDNGDIVVLNAKLDKVIMKLRKPLDDWLKTNEALNSFNESVFREEWDKYFYGGENTWEMQTLCYYLTTEHEIPLEMNNKYNFTRFYDESAEPIILSQRQRGNRIYYDYKLARISGTVIGFNNTKHVVSILTNQNEVVDVKFYGGTYANYSKQISKKLPSGDTQVIEKSWFARGQLIAVVGYRQDDMFRAKTQSNFPYSHTVQKIVDIQKDNGIIIFQDERANA